MMNLFFSYFFSCSTKEIEKLHYGKGSIIGWRETDTHPCSCIIYNKIRERDNIILIYVCNKLSQMLSRKNTSSYEGR